MKKVIAVLLGIVLLLAAVPMGAVSAATTGTYNGMEYKIENGQVTLTGHTSALPKTLVIPDTIEGYPVTTIGYKAFEDADSLLSVTIPDSVTFLDDYAFAWCFRVKTIDVGNGVTKINYGAFSYCSYLTRVDIGRNAIDISPYAFMSDGDLTAVNVDPANPSYCSVDGVLYNKAMTYLIYYPGGKPGAYTVPEGITHIYGSAFDFCDTITAITLPSTLTGIPEQCFADCQSFAAIHVAEDNPYMASMDGIVYSKDKKTLMFCPSGKSGAVVIPEGVTSIRGSAFHHCEKMTSVTIPNTVTTIGDSAFGYCHGLRSVTIPDSVTEIGDYIFYDCNNLATAYVGDGITRLSQMTFYDCHKLKTIRLPDHLTYIGFKAIWNTAYYNDDANWVDGVLYFDNYLIDTASSLSGDYVIPEGTTVVAEYSFHGRSKVTSVTIPEGVRAIEYSTFSTCEKLAYVILPRSLTFVGEWAFSYCNKLKNVYYAGSKEDVANITFSSYNDPLLEATWHCNYAPEPEILSGTTGDCTWALEDGCLTISGSGAMADYTNGSTVPWGNDRVTAVVIEEGVTAIGAHAFEYHEGLSQLSIPDTVTTIGAYAFSDCYFLTTLSIPDSVVTVGNGALSYLPCLELLTIGKNVVSLGDDNWWGSFSADIVVSEENAVYSSLNGDLYNKDKTELIRVSGRHTGTYAVLDGVISIADYAMWSPYDVDTLILPDSVKTIGIEAFGMGNLKKVVLGEGLEEIGPYAFCFNGALNSVEMGSNVKVIGEGAFGYTGLTAIALGEGVTTIEAYAFEGCDRLTSLTLGNRVTTIQNGAFNLCDNLSDVYYGGTETEQATIAIGEGNDALLGAVWHCASSAVIPGDADSNGKVNNRDLGRLQQYLNEWAVTIDTQAVDMDGNGKVNNRDLGLLQRQLNS